VNTIPCANPGLDNIALHSELVEAVSRVVEKGRYILDDEVAEFEREFSSFLGVHDTVGVSSGTAALVLGLSALNIGYGDEVIIPSHTAVATASAVITVGAKPVFADIEEDFLTIDPTSIQKLITNKTKAVIAVHMYGQPAQMLPLEKICKSFDLFLIEDCAQAVGSKYFDRNIGTIGDVGCFSFYPTKNLGAMGDAGCIVAKSIEVSEKLRRLRQYGWGKDRTNSEISGFNARLDEVQAAILRIKLRHLETYNLKRSRIAAIYNDLIQDDNRNIILPRIRPNCIHTFHLYVIRSGNRDQLQSHMLNQGISTGIHYKLPVHRQTAYERFVGPEKLRVTDSICDEILSLPMFPALSFADAERVVEALNSF